MPRRIVDKARSFLAAATLLGCCAALGACGGGGDSASGGGLTVSAAASLQKAFTLYAAQFARRSGDGPVHLSFAGSDALAAQIESGLKPDVFASANTTLPAALYAHRLVERPLDFAANRLVIAVPAGSSVRGAADLARADVTVAVGSRTVPIGSYTRKVLSRLPPSLQHGIAVNIRDEEPDVTGIVGKLTQHAVDAGFVYATDVRAAGGQLRAVALPQSAQPTVTYAAAVVRGAPHAAQARAFIEGLLHGAGVEELRQAGFLPPG
jgi:molybdate transport system substrate-binding protein